LDEVQGKTHHAALTSGGELVAKGEVEMGFFNLSEIPKGVTVAGPLPGPLQGYTSYEAAVLSKGSMDKACAGFVKYLASAPAAAHWEAAKLEPCHDLHAHPREPVKSCARARENGGGHPHQSWRKLLRILDRLGCLSLRSALASIWRMGSRVTENWWPTSSSVWSLFMPMPKRMRIMRSSRGVSEASVRGVVSRRVDRIASSVGVIAFLYSMKSPRWESSSSPIGVSSDNGSFTILSTLRTFSSGMPSFSASSSGVGSRPISLSNFRDVRMILLTTSIMC